MLRINEMHRERDEVHDILQAANKHPSSKVAKLIHTVQDEPSQRNIVLLLIELAEHSEFSVDFGISLKYYLNLFEDMCRQQQIILNEAGLLLINSSKIYARRVDFVEAQVERQVLSLSKVNEDADKTNDGKSRTKKIEMQNENNMDHSPKRRRKRVFEITSNDGTEIELKPKKLCTIDSAKRFAPSKSSIQISQAFSMTNTLISEDYIHPSSWLFGTIYDLEHDDEIDSKRNYKLFTCHVEHRYNTLVPDINFQLHFKVKDFLNVDGQSYEKGELCNEDRVWPAIPDTYIQQYISLENYILKQEVQNSVQCNNTTIQLNYTNESSNSAYESNELTDTQCGVANNDSDIANCLHSTILTQDSSITEITNNEVSALSNTTSFTTSLTNNDSSGNETLATDTSNLENLDFADALSSTNLIKSTTILDTPMQPINLPKISNVEDDLENLQVRFKEEIILFGDLRKKYKHILNAKVRLKDIMAKSRRLNDAVDQNITTNSTKLKTLAPQQPISLNIFKIPVKHLYKRVLFKLGKEFHLYKKNRLTKQTKCNTEVRSNNTYGLSTMFPEVCNSPTYVSSQASSPSYCSDFAGFSECSGIDFEGFDDNSNEKITSRHLFEDYEQNDNNSTFYLKGSITSADSSTDSGIGNDSINTTTDDTTNHNSDCNIVPPNDTDETVNELTSNCLNESEGFSRDLGSGKIFDNDRGSLSESKIRQWHEYLRPILSTSRERHHFDVFDIGSEIIECIQKNNNLTNNIEANENCKTSLEAVMDDKDKSHVSRYFLSTLLLVNQSNVKLSVPSTDGEEPVAWKDINMELISIVRHKVDFADANPIDINSLILSNDQPTKTKYKSSDQHIKTKHQKEKLQKRKINTIEDEILEDMGEDSTSAILTNSTTCNTRIKQNNYVSNPPLKAQRLSLASASAACGFSQRTLSNNIMSFSDLTTNKQLQEAVVLNAETVCQKPIVSNNLLSALPTTDILIDTRQTKEKRTLDAYLALESLKPLVAINITERQNDDLDSGIFSNGDMPVIF